MKHLKNLIYVFIALFAITSFTACSDDDDDNIENASELPAKVMKAFSNRYPDTQVESWTKKNAYYIVNFTLSKTRAAGVKASAWFGEDNLWKMTERDESFDGLPAAVREAFMASAYADWKIDDIDVVEREGMRTIFVIEAEQGDMEYDLYFLEDGTLMKEVPDEDDDEGDDDDYLPEIPSKILNFLAEKYAGYVVTDAEFEDGKYEIEFMLDNKEYEVAFDSAFNWLGSEYEMEPEELPGFIKDYISTNYPGYEIDDVSVISDNDGTYYVIELENDDDDEVIIKFDLNGEFMM